MAVSSSMDWLDQRGRRKMADERGKDGSASGGDGIVGGECNVDICGDQLGPLSQELSAFYFLSHLTILAVVALNGIFLY